MHVSETSKIRHLIAGYCVGCGVDVGFGGDPVIESAICIDKLGQVAYVGESPCHIRVDGPPYLTDIFAVESLDYVYSSHLLEDYPQDEINILIDEWGTLLVPGGHMIICCPDEQLYRLHCKQEGTQPNTAHINPEFGSGNITRPMLDAGLEIVSQTDLAAGEYSFVIVGVKK